MRCTRLAKPAMPHACLAETDAKAVLAGGLVEDPP